MMPDQPAPTVSVIVAAYNAATTLKEAVASIQAQTLREIEIIVVDDRSTDNTLQLAQDLSALDSRVRALAAPRNGGPAAARNLGLAAARGEWIAIVDADDDILPERLAAMVAASNGYDIVFDNLLYIDGGRTSPYIGDAAFADPLDIGTFINSHRRSCPVPNLGFLKPLIRRAALEENALRYDTTLKIGEDALLIFDLLAFGARACLLPDAYYRYHRHSGSISARQDAASIRAINQAYRDFAQRHTLPLGAWEKLQLLIDDNEKRLAAAEIVDDMCAGKMKSGLIRLSRDPRLLKPSLREAAGRMKRRLTA